MTIKRPITITTLANMKARGEPIACLTAYDYSFASILDKTGVEIILVGDSVGMVVQGHLTTLPVTVDDLVYHTKCVSRGVETSIIIADMPFGSFQLSPQKAFENAARLLGEGGAQMVKIEGGEFMRETVEFLVERGIPVCGHIGLTPQSVNQFGGFKVQGRETEAARKIENDAVVLDRAGVSVLILEAMPSSLADSISKKISAPTIGIGAGPQTDGQVLVLYDLLGLYPKKSPKFSKDFLAGAGSAAGAVEHFLKAVKAREFPGPEHCL